MDKSAQKSGLLGIFKRFWNGVQNTTEPVQEGAKRAGEAVGTYMVDPNTGKEFIIYNTHGVPVCRDSLGGVFSPTRQWD